MEEDGGIVMTGNSLKLKPDDKFWSRALESGSNSICFGTAFRLGKSTDLTSFAKALPVGFVLCDAKLIAGVEHLESVLLQTNEYWKRNQRLVRNGSIEILLRISCNAQISDAIVASNITAAEGVAMIGLASSRSDVEKVLEGFLSQFTSARIDTGLLKLNVKKARFLKKFHRLPASLNNPKLQTALQEKSVLLVFSK